jgi:hypothetical protein
LKLKEFHRQTEMTTMSEPSTSDISIERLIELGLTALDREIRNLTFQSSKGKLDAPSAKDLRDHIKLLFELQQREADFLKGLTDEQLQAILDKRKNESKPDGGIT